MSLIENDPPNEEELPPLSDYGQRFVEKIPEEHRPIADQWVREWDAGVGKLRSGYEEKLSQYNRLGDYEDVAAGVQLFRMLTGGPDDQQKIADYLAEQGVTPKQIAAMKKEADDAKGSEKDPYAERFDKIERAVGLSVEQQQAYMAAQERQRAQNEYVGMLDAAEKKHGAFDRDYVSFLLSQGKASTLDEAVAAYHKLNPGQRRATTPNLLGASGNAPIPGGKKINYADVDDKDISKLLVARLEQARDANG